MQSQSPIQCQKHSSVCWQAVNMRNNWLCFSIVQGQCRSQNNIHVHVARSGTSRVEEPMKSRLIKLPPFLISTWKENLVQRVVENSVNPSAHEVLQGSNISVIYEHYSWLLKDVVSDTYNQSFKTPITTARHWIKSWTTSIHLRYSQPMSLRSVLILGFLSGFSTKILCKLLVLPFYLNVWSILISLISLLTSRLTVHNINFSWILNSSE